MHMPQPRSTMTRQAGKEAGKRRANYSLSLFAFKTQRICMPFIECAFFSAYALCNVMHEAWAVHHWNIRRIWGKVCADYGSAEAKTKTLSSGKTTVAHIFAKEWSRIAHNATREILLIAVRCLIVYIYLNSYFIPRSMGVRVPMPICVDRMEMTWSNSFEFRVWERTW